MITETLTNTEKSDNLVRLLVPVLPLIDHAGREIWSIKQDKNADNELDGTVSFYNNQGHELSFILDWRHGTHVSINGIFIRGNDGYSRPSNAHAICPESKFAITRTPKSIAKAVNDYLKVYREVYQQGFDQANREALVKRNIKDNFDAIKGALAKPVYSSIRGDYDRIGTFLPGDKTLESEISIGETTCNIAIKNVSVEAVLKILRAAGVEMS